MKNKQITPTDREKVMRENDFIVSKTDTKGRITYGNQIFIEFSGYSEKELLGAQHNIIRHPDMPRAVFKLLWDTISQGKEIFAFVKNMAKDGSFYWVFANVTPDYDEKENIIGYFSVRRKPNPEALAAVSGLYAQMLDAEKQAGAKDAIDASTQLLLNFLAEKGVSYEELIIALQG
ncbi:MAG: PAS domain-containing protein [Gammaproteobacteria bacterium]|nr:PAS domain-containing protein [Gammaproteobacteria bacterium]